VTLLLLDTASLYYRAFFGVPASITAPDGTPVNAIRGFLDTTARLISTRHPDRLVACLDADWRPGFRVAAIPSYKAHRLAAGDPAGGEDVPPALAIQVPPLLELLDAVGLAAVGVTGFEADDVIGTLATTAVAPVEVVTGDRDMFQAVDDRRPVRVLYPARGISTLVEVDEAWLAAKYGLEHTGRPGWVGRAYGDVAILRGDPSDGLPGVAGVGEKTAVDLINRFGGLARLLAAVGGDAEATRAGGELPRGLRERLDRARGYLAVAPAVVRLRQDVPLPEHDPGLPATPRDPDRATRLAERWGVTSSLGRLADALRVNRR
jgi:5'-3' exonuclease